jgi:ribonuclease P protein subunit POP4
MPNYNNRNIVLHELIGLNVEVIKSNDKYLKGIKGMVVNETKNTLLISTGSKTKIVPKMNSTFRFSYGKKRFVVNGVEINFRPYERIEKSYKFYKRRRE